MKDPAFLFYTQDFYIGTRLMTPEQRACYIDLLIYQHQYQLIPNDLDRVLLFCTGVAKATLEATLKAKFKQGDKGWYNEKLKDVILERQVFKEKTSQSGKIGQLYKKIKALLPAKEATKIKRYLDEMGIDFVIFELESIDLKDNNNIEGWLIGLLKHLEDEDKDEDKSNSWRKDFEIYLKDLREAYKKLLEDEKWIAQQERLNPGVDIRMSVEKASVNFWAKEGGWKKKKQSRTANIDWPSTFANAITMQMNRVWKPK